MQGNEGRLDLWPCRQLGMPGWHWRSPRMAGARLAESDSVGDSLWSRENDSKQDLSPWHRPGCLHPGLNQPQRAGIRDLAGLGEAGKRGWDLSWVSRCRRGSESPHPAWESFGSPNFHWSSRVGLWDEPLEGLAGFPVGSHP